MGVDIPLDLCLGGGGSTFIWGLGSHPGRGDLAIVCTLAGNPKDLGILSFQLSQRVPVLGNFHGLPLMACSGGDVALACELSQMCGEPFA